MILQATDEAIQFAAAALRAGDLIGFPTETVYGIAAAATNPEAVRKTFALKKRPAENPLIVHVRTIAAAEDLVARVPESARRLANKFWPGPLTLVMPRSLSVPDEVTGGLNTVAIRVPRHPVALAILEESGLPLTAPSANTFMGLSPTRADHISQEVLAGLACIVDGGPCDVGVESTVVDCTGDAVSILRPGGISRAEIESLFGCVVREAMHEERRSPGLYKRHYSPKTPLRIVKNLEAGDAGIGFDPPAGVRQIQLARDPAKYAQDLYSSLFRLDLLGCGEILVEAPPESADWEAIWDRLRKAAGDA